MKGKPAVGLLIGPASEPDEDDDEQAGSGAADAAAAAILKAVKGGDTKALSRALRAHYDACAMDGDSDD